MVRSRVSPGTAQTGRRKVAPTMPSTRERRSDVVIVAMTKVRARFSPSPSHPQFELEPCRSTTSSEGKGRHQTAMPCSLASGSSCCRIGTSTVECHRHQRGQVPHREKEIRPFKEQIGPPIIAPPPGIRLQPRAERHRSVAALQARRWRSGTGR
jgi:hypothetical protein